MPETKTVAAPGVPGWVDLASADIEATKKFYTGVFGWTAWTVPDPAAGGYTIFSLGAKQVAAVTPQQNASQPQVWSTYVIVADADAAQAKVVAAGGTVLMPVMQVMDQGRMGVFMDPTGAAISVWQPQQMNGADVFNVPGALCWNELQTRDVAAAKPFYAQVFGWGAETSDGAMPYTEWTLGDRRIAGMMPMSAEIPASVPANWLVYFAVSDINASVAKVTELGGSVLMAPFTADPGTFAVVADCNGAAFAIIQLKG